MQLWDFKGMHVYKIKKKYADVTKFFLSYNFYDLLYKMVHNGPVCIHIYILAYFYCTTLFKMRFLQLPLYKGRVALNWQPVSQDLWDILHSISHNSGTKNWPHPNWHTTLIKSFRFE